MNALAKNALFGVLQNLGSSRERSFTASLSDGNSNLPLKIIMGKRSRRLAELSEDLAEHAIRESVRKDQQSKDGLFFVDAARVVRRSPGVKLYVPEPVEPSIPPKPLSAELRVRRTAPAKPHSGAASALLADLWGDEPRSTSSRRERHLQLQRAEAVTASASAPAMPSWVVASGHGSVPHAGLSVNPDAGNHAALMRDAGSAEERAMQDARLRVARLLPDSHSRRLADAPPSAEDCEADTAGAEFAAAVLSVSGESSHVVAPMDDDAPQRANRVRAHAEPRRRLSAADAVALSLPFTAPLADELSNSLRSAKIVGAQLVAAERLTSLTLSTRLVPRKAEWSVTADGEAIVRRRRAARPRAFPFRMVEFPRRAPELRSLAPRQQKGDTPPPGADPAAPEAPLVLLTGDDDGAAESMPAQEKKRTDRQLQQQQQRRGGNLKHARPAIQRAAGGVHAHALAAGAGAGVLRSGVLTAAEIAGMTLQYSTKARQEWKPQS